MSSESEAACDSCYRCNADCGHHASALATERKAREEAEARALTTENRINAALMMSQSREESAVEALATERKARETAESQRNELADALASCRAERDALKNAARKDAEDYQILLANWQGEQGEVARLKGEVDEWKKRAAALDGASSIHAHCRAEIEKWERRANESRVQTLNRIGDEIATLRADLKRKEEALREARDLATKEPRKNPTSRLEAAAAILSAALSPSPEGRSEERRHRFEARDDSSAGNCAACGEEWAAAVHSPAPAQSEAEDVQHLRNPDGSCVVSLGGQGHMPCGVHAPVKAESPARCACRECKGSGRNDVGGPCFCRWSHDHPTTPEPQEGE